MVLRDFLKVIGFFALLTILGLMVVGSAYAVYWAYDIDVQFEEQYPNPLTCEQITSALDHDGEHELIEWQFNDTTLTQKWITTKCFEGGD